MMQPTDNRAMLKKVNQASDPEYYGVGANAVLTHVPTLDCPTITSRHPAPNNNSKYNALRH